MAGAVVINQRRLYLRLVLLLYRGVNPRIVAEMHQIRPDERRLRLLRGNANRRTAAQRERARRSCNEISSVLLRFHLLTHIWLSMQTPYAHCGRAECDAVEVAFHGAYYTICAYRAPVLWRTDTYVLANRLLQRQAPV